MGFGKNVREQRRAMGMTQEQLSERTGVSQGSISTIERDERVPKLPTAVALARGLETTVEELLGEDVEEEQAA